MNAINLLPQSLASNSQLANLARGLRKINLVATIVLIAGLLGLTALMGVNSALIKASEAKQDRLKLSIKALQSVEQQYTLVGDRVSKVKTVLAKSEVDQKYANLEKVIVGLSPDAYINQVDISTERMDIVVSFSDSKSITNFMGNITGLNLFKKVVMSSFSFKPGVGYLIAYELY